MVRMCKNKKEKLQITIIMNEKGDVITDTEEIKKLVRDYTFDNSDVMDRFIEKRNRT